MALRTATHFPSLSER